MKYQTQLFDSESITYTNANIPILSQTLIPNPNEVKEKKSILNRV